MRAEYFVLRAELRGEKRLYIMAALTAAFATAALTLALAVGETFERSFSASAKSVLGGDVSLRLRQRAFLPEETEWLRENSGEISALRVAAALAFSGENNQMVRLKITDSAYPLYGTMELQNKKPNALKELLSAGADADGAYPAAVAADLPELLGIKTGDTFTAAGVTFRVAEIVEREPDPDSRLWMAAPVVLAGAAAGGALPDAGLLSEHYIRARFPEGEGEESWTTRLRGAFPEADWRVRVAQEAAPGVRRFVERMRVFLSVMSLAAILTAGIGINGAASAFMRARVRAIAVVKMLGGAERFVVRVYLKIALLFIVGGAAAGAFAGAAALFWAAPHLFSALPLDIAPVWPWAAFLKALLSASALGAACVVFPVLRAGRANPLSLFNAGGNENETPPPVRRDAYLAAAIWIPLLLLLPLEWTEKAAAAGIALAAGLVYALSSACARFAGTAAGRIRPPVSWGLLSVSRNRRQTAAGVVSLGAGMALLVAVLNIEENFSARIDDTLSREAPALYFLGIRPEQRAELEQTLRAAAPQTRLRAVPFLRGKIKSIGGRTAEEIAETAPEEERWIVRGDRGLTWTDGEYIGESEVTEGELWDESEPRPQVSFDEEAAHAYGVSLGDEMVLSILGRRLTAVITNFREIDWQSFDINFAVILDGRPFGDAPHSLFGAAFMPAESEPAAKLAAAREFPNITPIAMGGVFDIGRRLLNNISILLQASALFMLIGAAPAVAASLMDGQRRRIRDAVVLRLLGAPSRSLLLKGFAEYSAMAAAALLPALLFGLSAGAFVVRNVFELDWDIGGGNPLGVAAAGFALFLVIGGADIYRWTRQPPLAVVRNE